MANESQTNTQAFLAAGGTQDILNKEKYGNKLSSGELQTFLTKYGLTTPAAQAYSAPNITAAATNPAPRPDDLMNIRSSIYGELGIPAMQAEQQKYYDQLNNYDTATDQGNVDTMNEQKTMGVLRGEQAQFQDQRNLGRSSIARSMDAINNRLSSAMTEAGARYDIRANEIGDVKNLMLQFPDAGISFGDSTEAMASKVKASNENKVVTDMFTQTFGYFPTGLSMDAMNKKLAKKYDSSKAYESAKQALELSNIQSTITARTASTAPAAQNAADKKANDAKTDQEKADKKAQDETDARSKFLDKVVQDYITKVGKERRQSAKDSLKEEARKKIESQYPGWGWVSDKIG